MLDSESCWTVNLAGQQSILLPSSCSGSDAAPRGAVRAVSTMLSLHTSPYIADMGAAQPDYNDAALHDVDGVVLQL